MKIKLPLIGVIACLLTVFSFAQSEKMSYFTVSPEKVEEYAKQDLLRDTADIFEIMDSCKALYFESKIEMVDAFLKKLEKYPKSHKIVNNFIRTSYMIRLEEGKDELDMPDVVVWLGKWGLDSLRWYLVNDLENQMEFSESALSIVKQMQGLEFSDPMQAHRYAKNLLAESFHFCNSDVDVAGKEYRAVLKSFLSGKRKHIIDSLRNVESAKCEKKANYGECIKTSFSLKKIINAADKVLKSYLDKEELFVKRYSGRLCSDELWQTAFEGLDALYSYHLLNVVESTLEKVDEFDDKVPVDVSQKTCGCSHKEELNGEVIGFYPYWYAGDTTKWVDFEGITRLAYYGLRAANDGSLLMPSGALALSYFEKEENYEFVNEAHRHNVQVDWVVYKDDWKAFNTKDKIDSFFTKVSDEIDSLLNKKVNSYFQRFVNTFTFYTDEFEFRGDGVTLFFKNFPTDNDATKAFNRFFARLMTRLEAKNEYVHVNQMMNRDDLAVNKQELLDENLSFVSDKGIYSYENFLNLGNSKHSLDPAKKASRKQIRDNVRKYLFVALDEPSSKNKRILLNDLNMQLDGYNRRNMLHALVPVVMFDNAAWDDFAVDALYYNDTYYNLGVAPYATALDADDVCKNSGNLGTCMLKYFENEDGDGLRRGGFSSFVCRYRWAFRFVNIMLFVIAIGILVAYFTSYRVADFFNSRLALLLGVVVAPSAIMMTLLSRFDPSVAEYRGTFGLIPILVLLLTVIAAILLQVYRKNDLPKRRGK